MVLNKKDKLAYKSHKLLMTTFHIFYQLLLGLENICTYSSVSNFITNTFTSLFHFSKVGIKPVKNQQKLKTFNWIALLSKAKSCLKGGL